jgi:phosphatidylinositol kinase/protein kinase (PI-3  family)
MLGEIVWFFGSQSFERILMVSPSFRILITGPASGLVETITDAVSIHSIKKAEYAKRLANGRLGHVTLLDHFISVCYSSPLLVILRKQPFAQTYGDPSSAKFVRAQRNFAKSLAGEDPFLPFDIALTDPKATPS